MEIHPPRNKLKVGVSVKISQSSIECVTFKFVLDWIVIIFLSTLMTTVDTLTLQAERQLRSQELRVLFKEPSDGFLVTPPVAVVSTHLMSPFGPLGHFHRL